MKEITNEEIKEIAEVIVEKANESENDYDAIDDVSSALRDTFIKMNISVEKINPDCKCNNCGCG